MCDWILFLAVYQDYMVYSDIKLCHIYLWNWGGPCYCYVISQLWHTSHLSSKLCDIMTVGCPPDWGGPCRRLCNGDSKTCEPVPRSRVGPNRDSAKYVDVYGVPEAHTVLRGTLRYKVGGEPWFHYDVMNNIVMEVATVLHEDHYCLVGSLGCLERCNCTLGFRR